MSVNKSVTYFQGCPRNKGAKEGFKIKNIEISLNLQETTRKPSPAEKLEAQPAEKLVFTIKNANNVEIGKLFELFNLVQNGKTRPRPERGRNRTNKGAKRLVKSDISCPKTATQGCVRVPKLALLYVIPYVGKLWQLELEQRKYRPKADFCFPAANRIVICRHRHVQQYLH